MDTHWNSKIENVLKIIGKQCQEYKKMHNEIAIRSERNHSALMITSIVITPLSGIVTTLGSVLCDEIKEYFYYTNISTILSFAAGILISITKFSKLDKTSNAHSVAAARYKSLENNIKRQLVLDEKDRIIATQYLDWVIKNFDDLYTSSPMLSNDILSKYTKFKDLFDDETENHDIESCQTEYDPIQRINLNNIKHGKNEKSYRFTTHQDLNKFDDDTMAFEISNSKE